MGPRLATLLLLAPLVAGCVAPKVPTVAELPAVAVGDVLAPLAKIEEVADGILVRWVGPVKADKFFAVTFPEGITRVDAQFTKADQNSFALSLFNAKTDRIRCQPDMAQSWFTVAKKVHRCSGSTGLDPFPTTWRASKSFLELKDGESLELFLANVPADGQAALIRAEALSMPRFAELPTQVTSMAASVDGAKIHVEVTRPDTPEKVPAIIVSNPYNQATRMAKLRPENSTIADWVPRGYAIVSADVRGFGLSGGCVEVWGANEQRDQHDLVEWVAAQTWSNGKIGFYGQSYVGTTAVEAASLAPPHLTTIVTIAPVINAYEDWHFGGVPNGENTGSPQSYQMSDSISRLRALEGDTSPAGIQAAADQLGRGLCDPTLMLRASDPRAVYDAFYAERDFKAKAKDVRASVFYTQGFYDTNVKSQMIKGWFDALDVPKKALFGDWVHQHPPRADQELLFHAWFDHWLMGLDTGIMETPIVEVRTNVDTIRTAADWPPADPTVRRAGLDLAGKRLGLDAAGSGSAQYVAHPNPSGTPQLPTQVVLAGQPLEQRLYLSGQLQLELQATLVGAPNTYFYARLLDVAPDGASRIVTWGMHNAALRNGYTTFEPVPEGQPIDYRLPFLPTEYVVEAGHRLDLIVRAADGRDWVGFPPNPSVPPSVPTSPNAAVGTVLNAVFLPGDVLANGGSAPGVVTLHGAKSALVLPTLPTPGDVAAPGHSGPRPITAA